MKSWVLLFVVLMGAPGIMAYDDVMDPDIDGIVAGTHGDAAAREALEQECIAVLSSDADWPAVHRAVRLLAIIGSERSIEVLAQRLDEPNSAHLARYALETMPQAQAGAALRDAFVRTTGATRMGVMASLAARGDSDAVPAISALLADEDLATAEAAAHALGKIGGAQAVQALQTALAAAAPALQAAIAESLLAAAPRLNDEAALRVYEQLMNAEFPDHVRSGAYRGQLNVAPDQAVEKILDIIFGDDKALRMTAVAAAAEVPGDNATERFASVLTDMPEDLQALMIESLAERGDPLGLSVMHDALGSANEGVRLAAMKAIADHGDVTSIAPVCALIEQSENRQEKLAAVETLRRLRGPDVDNQLIAALESAPHSVRPELMEALVQRDTVAAMDAFVIQTRENPVRGAAFRALGQMARPDHLSVLLDLVSRLEGDDGRAEAETALVNLCRRIAREKGEITIEKALYGDLPDGEVRDVTGRVVKMVQDGGRAIGANNGNFGDPAPNTVKRLRVDFVVNEIPGSLTVSEGETLQLPVDIVPGEVVDALKTALEQGSSAAKISLLRTAGRLGDARFYEVLLAHINHEDVDVRDGAVRALANWPEPQATPALARIFADTAESAHRMIALRGCVRLLRLGRLEQAETLALYGGLIAAAKSADERKLIIAGLADIAHPEAFAMVAPFIEDEAVREEAQVAAARIREAVGDSVVERPAPAVAPSPTSEGFIRLFDGNTLDGWSGAPGFWRVEEGHIVGETTEDHPTEVNTFLIWEGGDVEDFELMFRYRLDSERANTGVQIRSERFDGHRVRGYQPDIASDDWISGICYEEGGRGILARRGERVVFTAAGEKESTRFAEEDALGRHIHANDWNTYRIIAQGNRFVSAINGQIMHEVVDDAPEARRVGIIAFQLHTGPPMKVRFADIQLKHLGK